MGLCSNCGNQYDSTFAVEQYGKKYEFDCFECAIHVLAPKCSHCGTRILGHGVQGGSSVFCCAHCARSEGQKSFIDRT